MKRTGWLILLLLAVVVWRFSAQVGSDLSAADISPDHEVVMFSAEWCGYCDQARNYLVENQIEFLEIDIESSVEANDRWRQAGGRGVPLTFIGEERIVGYSATIYSQALDRL
jgi:glutaredoxin